MSNRALLALSITLLACADRPPTGAPPLTRALPPKLVPRPARAPSANAFRDGGAPLYDDAVDVAARDALAKLIDRANAHGAADGAELDLARALFARADRGLDEGWRALIVAIERWRQARNPDLVAASELQGPTRALDDVFARLGLGYYLHASNTTDAKTGRVQATLDFYRVAQVDRVLAAGTSHRVLELAGHGGAVEAHEGGELDAPLRPSGEPDEPQGLVYLDTVERVSRNFISFLVAGAPTFPTAYRPSRDPDGRDPRDVIGAAMRREIDAAIGAPDDMDRWLEQLRALIVASCARHEVQHILDWTRATMRPRPAQVIEIIGPGLFGAFVDAELTAYVSQIANEPAIPHLMLGLQLAYALDDRSGHLGQIAVIMFEGIAHHLGITDFPATVHDGMLDRERMVRLAERVMEADVARLRAAAAAEWQELYGDRVATIVYGPE